MDGVHRLCRNRDIPPLDGRAMLRCERAEGRRDTAVALCDSGEEGLRYLLFFKSRGRARGLQKLMGTKDAGSRCPGQRAAHGFCGVGGLEDSPEDSPEGEGGH